MQLARPSGTSGAVRTLAAAFIVILLAWAWPAHAQTPTPTPGGDCCSAHAGPGCDVPACQECVCGIDSFCCSTEWDDDCVQSAENTDDCAANCPCPTATPTMLPTPGGDCCGAHDGPSCDDEACRTCVCDLD